MADDLEEKASEFDLEHYLGLVRRRYLHFLLPVFLGWLMMDERLYEAEKIKGLLPVAVLAEIPVIVNPADERNNRRKAWVGWEAATAVFACILAGSVFSYWRG